MKKCPNCQAEFSDEQLFCANCGAKLDPAEMPVPKHPNQKKIQYFGLIIILLFFVSSLVLSSRTGIDERPNQYQTETFEPNHAEKEVSPLTEYFEYVNEMTTTQNNLLATGICGVDVAWALEDTGTLTIYGRGEMFDYAYQSGPFYDLRDSITSVVVENGVNGIGAYSFCECAKIQKIALPESVTSIGDAAFADCFELTDINIPTAVTRVEKWVFQRCSKLKEIALPANLEFIGYAAFIECNQIKSITIPHSVTAVEAHAFDDWDSSQVIFVEGYDRKPSTWENSWKSGSAMVVWDGENATVADISASGTCGRGVEWTLDTSGLLTIYGSGDMSDYEYQSGPFYDLRNSITSVVVEDGVNSIGAYSLCECAQIQKISLPESVTSIDDAAFADCFELTDINIPAAVTRVEKWVFQRCSKLKEIALPADIEFIGYAAFFECNQIKVITIPASVTTIEEAAFNKWKEDQVIRVEGYSARPEGWNIKWAPADVTILWDV